MNATATSTTSITGQADTTRHVEVGGEPARATAAARIEFDPMLMETVVTRALAAAFAGPAGFTHAAFHREADPLYACNAPEQRAASFRQLFARWFCRGQFDRPFIEALAELPGERIAIDVPRRAQFEPIESVGVVQDNVCGRRNCRDRDRARPEPTHA